ncbi:redoxin domain-containing protein [Roseovarius arcticus]|uniref:redoxin domain-containing protein n=1 Tax=Roseovarius arcticus TaxID=2547404 RepID=UPI001FECB294|nr:redoxin domain-containing protein [Roseovarius arcticus]
MHNAMTPDTSFPKITVSTLDGAKADLGQPNAERGDWQLVVVYRGKHCPICKTYLTELNGLLDDFAEIDVDVIAVSADPEDKATDSASDIGYSGTIGYDLSLAQMGQLGVYISDPRSPEETDRPFAEPATFVVRDDGKVQIVDVSNAPFSRPALKGLLDGLTFIRKKDYPVRGTHSG